MSQKTCPVCRHAYDAGPNFCPRCGSALELASGTLVDGKYRIVRLLGQGAMGAVYEASELALGNRATAIKILRIPVQVAPAELTEMLGRLLKEAEMLGKLGEPHPNLVTVYTTGRLAGSGHEGHPYVAMEYVDGPTLRDVLDAGPPYSPSLAAKIVTQIANGLDHAHARGVIHRDLKPRNVMLANKPVGDGWVKVVDFGIATAVESVIGDLTRTGQVIGTVPYMSPERRAAAAVDARCDVYSLAIIAAELLLDDPDEIQLLGVGLDALAEGRFWPPKLEAVLARGLAASPEDRFDTARDFADAFREAMDSWGLLEPGLEGPSDPGLRSGDEELEGFTDLVAALSAGGQPNIPQNMASRPARRPRRKAMVAVSVLGVAALGIVASTRLLPDRGPLLAEPSDHVATDSTDTSTAEQVDDSTPEQGDGATDQNRSDPARLVEATGASPSGSEGTLPEAVPEPVDDAPTATAGSTVDLVAVPPPLDSIRSVDYGPYEQPIGWMKAQLAGALDEATLDGSAMRRVVDSASTLLAEPQLPTAVVAITRYLKAEAHLLLDEQAAACLEVRELERGMTAPDAQRSEWLVEGVRSTLALRENQCSTTAL